MNFYAMLSWATQLTYSTVHLQPCTVERQFNSTRLLYCCFAPYSCKYSCFAFLHGLKWVYTLSYIAYHIPHTTFHIPTCIAYCSTCVHVPDCQYNCSLTQCDLSHHPLPHLHVLLLYMNGPAKVNVRGVYTIFFLSFSFFSAFIFSPSFTF